MSFAYLALPPHVCLSASDLTAPRFINDKVSESVKPRGVVDLSKVQDVKPGSTVTGETGR